MTDSLPIEYIDSLLEIDPHICYDATYFSTRQASLRIIRLWNDNVRTDRILVFIPGWASTIFTWRYFLPKLLCFTSVYYLETREKASSILTNDAMFDVDVVVDDLVSYLDTKHSNNQYVLAGASMGATLVLQAWSKLRSKPSLLVLILPNKQFPAPPFIGFVKFFPKHIFPYMKPLVRFFLSNFWLASKEAEQQAGLFAAIDNADINKLRASCFALRKYRLKHAIGKEIKQPCLVIGASQDHLHKSESVINIYESVPVASYADLKSFTAAHSSRAADSITEWIKQHNG